MVDSPTHKRNCLSAKVAFQGEKGAYSESAGRGAFKDTDYQQVETVGFPTFKAVFDAVESATCEFGIIPIENSVSGTLHVVYDHLIRSTLKIVGECTAVEEHCLCVCSGTEQQSITQIMSHPVILEQCEAFISNLERKYGREIQRVSAWDRFVEFIT